MNWQRERDRKIHYFEALSSFKLFSCQNQLIKTYFSKGEVYKFKNYRMCEQMKRDGREEQRQWQWQWQKKLQQQQLLERPQRKKKERALNMIGSKQCAMDGIYVTKMFVHVLFLGDYMALSIDSIEWPNIWSKYKRKLWEFFWFCKIEECTEIEQRFSMRQRELSLYFFYTWRHAECGKKVFSKMYVYLID